MLKKKPVTVPPRFDEFIYEISSTHCDAAAFQAHKEHKTRVPIFFWFTNLWKLNKKYSHTLFDSLKYKTIKGKFCGTEVPFPESGLHSQLERGI